MTADMMLLIIFSFFSVLLHSPPPRYHISRLKWPDWKLQRKQHFILIWGVKIEGRSTKCRLGMIFKSTHTGKEHRASRLGPVKTLQQEASDQRNFDGKEPSRLMYSCKVTGCSWSLRSLTGDRDWFGLCVSFWTNRAESWADAVRSVCGSKT